MELMTSGRTSAWCIDVKSKQRYCFIHLVKMLYYSTGEKELGHWKLLKTPTRTPSEQAFMLKARKQLF